MEYFRYGSWRISYVFFSSRFCFFSIRLICLRIITNSLQMKIDEEHIRHKKKDENGYFPWHLMLFISITLSRFQIVVFWHILRFLLM